MPWSLLFAITNAIAMIGWLLLAALPRGPRLYSVVLYACVAMLCLVYAAMFVALFAGIADPVRIPNAPPASLSDYSLPGLRALFMSDGGITLGWTHYLALDLFTGLWIARDADSKGFSRWAQLPVLFATLMAGPLGLLIWLAVRERLARRVTA